MTRTQKKISTPSMIFALLCGNAVVMYIDRTNMAIAAPVIQHELHLSNTSLGLVFSAISFSYAGFMLVGGRLGDIFGSRIGLTICGVVWAAGTFATGLAGGLMSLVCARFLVGMGESAVYPISSSVIGRWIAKPARGSAQGILHGFGRLGAALAPGIVTILLVEFSWRLAFFILGVFSLVLAGIVWLYLRDDPRVHPGVTPEELEKLGHTAQADVPVAAIKAPPLVWSDFLRRVWPVTAVSFCYGWTSWFLLSWMPLYFTHSHGLNLKHVAIFSTLVLIGGVVGMVCGGIATDWWLKRTGSARRARRDIIIFSFLSAMLSIVALLFSTNLIVDTALLSFGYFLLELADPSIWMLGMEVLPSHASTSTAAVNTGFAVAGIVSPLVVGWLLDATGGNWNDVFMVSIVVLLIGPLVAWRIRKTEDDAVQIHGATWLQNIP